MTGSTLLPRLAAAHAAAALAVMPVVALTGARQTGKSTLARLLATGDEWLHTSLDDPAVLGRAREDPHSFVRQAPRMVIDEVQRDPDLLLAIKEAVDGDQPRRPGRFLLTGSANLLLMKRVRDSLAGRATYVTLHPLTRREQLGLGSAGIWGDLLATAPTTWRDLIQSQVAPEEDWRALARRGGYPPAAWQIEDDEHRRFWFDGYHRTYLQRDVPELSDVANIPAFNTVLRSVAMRTGTVVNQTQLARDASLPQSTVNRYIAILETSYQLLRLPAYSASRTRQLARSPKYYWNDTGLALFLAGDPEPGGAHLENVIVQDAEAWSDARLGRSEVMYWRTSKGHEVDLVVDDGTRLLPVEIKATSRPSTGDLASLRMFLEEYSTRAPAGLLLHTGDQTFWIATSILAVPWWRVI